MLSQITEVEDVSKSKTPDKNDDIQLLWSQYIVILISILAMLFAIRIFTSSINGYYLHMYIDVCITHYNTFTYFIDNNYVYFV